MFAGEATHSDYFATVHGAIESGLREANRISQVSYFMLLIRCRQTVSVIIFLCFEIQGGNLNQNKSGRGLQNESQK